MTKARIALHLGALAIALAILLIFSACSEDTASEMVLAVLAREDGANQLATAKTVAQDYDEEDIIVDDLSDFEIVTIIAGGLVEALLYGDKYDKALEKVIKIKTEVNDICLQSMDSKTLVFNRNYADDSNLLKAVYYDANGNLTTEVFYDYFDEEEMLTATYNTDGTLYSLIFSDDTTYTYDLSALTSSNDIDDEYGDSGLVYTDSKGNIVKKIWYGSYKKKRYVCAEKYYYDGDEIRLAKYGRDGNLVYDEYYGDVGLSTYYDSSGTMYRFHNYYYDDFYHYAAKNIDYDSYHYFCARVVYYDSNETLARTGYYYDDGNLVFEDTYDTNGNVTSTDYYENLGVPVKMITDTGNITNVTLIQDGSYARELTFSNVVEDDAEAIFLSDSFYSDGSLICESVFDKDGNLAKDVYYFDGDKIGEDTYDSDGNRTRATRYSGGVVVSDISFDEEGNKTSKTVAYDYAKHNYDYANGNISLEVVNTCKSKGALIYSDSDSDEYIRSKEFDYKAMTCVKYYVATIYDSTVRVTKVEGEESLYRVVANVNVVIEDVEENQYLEAYLDLVSCDVLTSSYGDEYTPVLKLNGEAVDITESQIANFISNIYYDFYMVEDTVSELTSK